jgi:transposase-like protein
MPRARRSFPAEFKARIVLQLLSGEASQAVTRLGPEYLKRRLLLVQF